MSLSFYKYTEFFCEGLLGLVNPGLSGRTLGFYHRHNPGIPLGISFFTFEFVHYLYEVRRNRTPIKNPVDFALFTIFFPSLVAGPIKRYSQFLASLKEGLRHVNSRDVAMGLMRIATGYFKKTCIADNLTAYIDCYVPVYQAISMAERWAVFFGISLRILMDFSGYSDIAIGFAQLFGIRLPENFNWPYLAANLQDFWQRWHISLSTWIRDYIYIPLGGSKAGLSRRVINGLLAFGLCGLWHGAAWHYVLWGLYQGVGLGLNVNYRKVGVPGRWLEILFSRAPVLGWLVTMAFVCLGWLIFFYPVNQALQMAEGLLPEQMLMFCHPEPTFDLSTVIFNPVVDTAVLKRLHAENIYYDGWLSDKMTMDIPENAPIHQIELEIWMPDWSGVPDSKIMISADGRDQEHVLAYGVTHFIIPLHVHKLRSRLARWLHFRHHITIQGSKAFILPKPDGRQVFFRIQVIGFY